MTPSPAVPDKRQQIRDSIFYLLPVVFGNILSILALAVFTRVLSVSDFGVLALAQIYATLAMGLSNLGLFNIYNRNFFKYREPETSGALLYSILLFVGVISGLVAVITWMFQDSLSKIFTGASGHGKLFFFAFASAAVQNIKGYLMRYLRNSERATEFVSYTTADAACTVVISIVIVLCTDAGVLAIVYGSLLSGISFTALLFSRFFSFMPFQIDRTILVDSLRLAYPLTPVALFGVIRIQFDKYMIGLLGTIGGVGLYSIAQRMTSVIFLYMTAVQNVFMPHIYKQMFGLGDRGGAAIGRYLTPFAWACTGVALGVVLLSEEVFYVLTPAIYHDAVTVVVILAMYYAILFFGKQPQLIFAKKTGIASAMIMFGVIVNVGMNIPFILKWGVYGAAWATFLSALIAGALSFIISQRYYRIGWEYGKLCMIFGTLIGASLFLLIALHFQIPYVWRVPVKFAALAFYGYLGFRLKIISRENVDIFIDIMKGIFILRLQKRGKKAGQNMPQVR